MGMVVRRKNAVGGDRMMFGDWGLIVISEFSDLVVF
jgi:hypothetical protein